MYEKWVSIMVKRVYNLAEMEAFLEMSKGLYDIVRLVDPVECIEITIHDGHLDFLDGCYNVWESGQRCKNCSSFKACRSGERHEKKEYFDENVYNILSNPVQLIVQDETKIDCIIEFITAHKADTHEKEVVNDRRSEVVESATLVDPLTSIYNWDGFHQNARKLINNHPDETCVIAAFDISHFKLINSLFGRKKGDDILIEVAGILNDYASDDVVVARMQADQFAICMPKSQWHDKDLLKKLDVIDNLLDESAFSLEIYAGVYEIKDRNLPVSTMYDRAVMAYISGYGRKESHAVTWFDESMLNELLYQQQVITSFERNLSSGEYTIFIQPQVDEKGHIAGGEALCRWMKPDGTIVPPIRFIPILEKAGLIAELDRHVWELAAKQLLKWQGTEFENMYLSVNISPLDFYFVDVYATITDLVEKYGIDKDKLKLEITETAIMSDVEKQIMRVADLRKYGFTVEIDDFGAGYSSLSMLKDIEADVLKIDMSFLRKTHNEQRSRHVLASIIEMAKRLNMETITEGVETSEQVEMLSRMGCHKFQGFYFAKPMPVEEFEEKAR